MSSGNQEQKRLKNVVNGFSSLDFKEKLVDKKGNMEVLYTYDPIFIPNINDTLQRFGNVKIEATSFTVSKPVELMSIAPHLYELATNEEKEILEKVFEVKPFNIVTISLERIFVDKLFAAEFYYVREKYTDLCKHIYDITIMCELDEINSLLNDKKNLNALIGLKRLEESRRIGGVSKDKKIKDFEYLNNYDFYESDKFKKALDIIHNIYVFDTKDKIEINKIIETLKCLRIVFESITETIKTEKDYEM